MLLSGSLRGYDCKIEFSNTLNPYVNFRMNGHFENSREVSTLLFVINKVKKIIYIFNCINLVYYIKILLILQNSHNDLDLYYSGDCRNPQNRITINQLYKRHYISSEDFNIITKNKSKYFF